jgi:hypothetical protein
VVELGSRACSRVYGLGEGKFNNKIIMDKPKFFSLAEMKQPVNQWICIAFLGLLCFWVVLFYSSSKAYGIGDAFSVTANIDR